MFACCLFIAVRSGLHTARLYYHMPKINDCVCCERSVVCDYTADDCYKCCSSMHTNTRFHIIILIISPISTYLQVHNNNDNNKNNSNNNTSAHIYSDIGRCHTTRLTCGNYIMLSEKKDNKLFTADEFNNYTTIDEITRCIGNANFFFLSHNLRISCINIPFVYIVFK